MSFTIFAQHYVSPILGMQQGGVKLTFFRNSIILSDFYINIKKTKKKGDQDEQN